MDEKPKPIPKYVQRVTVDDDLEVKYWTKKFGCTANQLRVAVKKVGVMVKSIEKELMESSPRGHQSISMPSPISSSSGTTENPRDI